LSQSKHNLLLEDIHLFVVMSALVSVVSALIAVVSALIAVISMVSALISVVSALIAVVDASVDASVHALVSVIPVASSPIYAGSLISSLVFVTPI
jgi:hypothetical protein